MRHPQHDGLAARVTDADHVANREYLRVPRKGQIGFDADAAGAVTFGSSQLGELAGEAGRGDAGSPNDGAAGDPLLLKPRSPPASVTPAASIPITVRPVRTVSPRRWSDRSAFAESEGGKLVSRRGGGAILER